MKQTLIILLAFTVACNNPETAKQQDHKDTHVKDSHAAAAPLNNGAKWKADEPTKQNVAAMLQVAEDASYQEADKRKQLAAAMQAQLDTLIKQCRMKGADHDALHVWLEKVLKDVKNLGDTRNAYGESVAILRKDIKAFYDVFE